MAVSVIAIISGFEHNFSMRIEPKRITLNAIKDCILFKL